MASLKRDFLFFLITLTAVEAVLSVLYYQLVQRINGTLVLGLLLYATVVVLAAFSYRTARYQAKRKQLLQELLA